MREHFLFPRVSIIVARVSDTLYLREHILMREHFAFSRPQPHYVLANAMISGWSAGSKVRHLIIFSSRERYSASIFLFCFGNQ
jgi:hypothetical protein